MTELAVSTVNWLKIMDLVEELQREACTLSGKDVMLSPRTRLVPRWTLWYEDNNRKYIYAKIDENTGDVYSASGKKPSGNVLSAKYGGKEFIDAWGVIVNKKKRETRLNEILCQNNAIYTSSEKI